MGNCFEGATKGGNSVPAPAKQAAVPRGNFKVCVVGGAGSIGQSLCLLLASDPNVEELCIYDLDISMVPPDGVAKDLSHVGKANVRAWTARREDRAIETAGDVFSGCHLVLVSTSVPRKPDQDRKDHLNINAGVAKNIVEACAKYCPQAIVGLIVNPVNAVVPAMCELWKKTGLNPKNIIGISTLDVVRANQFVHETTKAPIEEIDIPVIGGASEATMLPLFSQDVASKTLSDAKIKELRKKLQTAGSDVIKAKKGKGVATLSMASAAARLSRAILAGLAGAAGVSECAYVESNACDGLPYFASKVTFGKDGVTAINPLPADMSASERQRLEELKPTLLEDIQGGLEYASRNEFAR